MKDCIFCKIIAGEITSNKVYEDEKVFAFDDIHPLAPVHVILIPKLHIPTLMDIQPDNQAQIAALLMAVPKIAQVKKIDERGFRAIINCKEEGGQVIFHLHMHIMGGKKLGAKLV